jgi:hypothetical protein
MAATKDGYCSSVSSAGDGSTRSAEPSASSVDGRGGRDAAVNRLKAMVAAKHGEAEVRLATALGSLVREIGAR